MKNAQVPRFWYSNTLAKSKNGNYRTDGSNLYSYKRVIGTTDDFGQKILYNYTNSSGGKFISSTTSHHVNLARFYADLLIDPNED